MVQVSTSTNRGQLPHLLVTVTKTLQTRTTTFTCLLSYCIQPLLHPSPATQSVNQSQSKCIWEITTQFCIDANRQRMCWNRQQGIDTDSSEQCAIWRCGSETANPFLLVFTSQKLNELILTNCENTNIPVMWHLTRTESPVCS